ncbi:methyltransferase domain-containing protein [Streptomyces sparsogenes]|uniref:methyltransferase domain-containing protein n=1 Tax=Streptomyces sparsogenes TaxID=67365 RepID=UPI00082415DA|nr:methyltransferase domain-containing protein [Streptomyces sparsogenes]
MNWKSRASSLAAELQESGDLTAPRLIEAVSSTPRHLFVPRYFVNAGGTPTLWRECTETDGDDWLRPIYSNLTLVTALDQAEQVTGGWHGTPTSSSTQPSLTCRMIEALDIQSDDHVLDGGLGTGYQAALIAAQLRHGNQMVACDLNGTSEAAARLKQLGLNISVVPADATSHNFNRRFDKAIFSFGLPRITDTIRSAMAPGGRLIANVFGPLSAALVLLEADDDGNLSGPFLKDGGAFMPARHEGEAAVTSAELTPASQGYTDIPVSVFDDYHFKFWLAAHLPGVGLQYGTEENQSTRRLVMMDGRWCELLYRDDKPEEPQFCGQGEPEVWETLRWAWQWWTEHNMPPWEHFGLTVTDTEHRLWYQSPDGQSWALR